MKLNPEAAAIMGIEIADPTGRPFGFRAEEVDGFVLALGRARWVGVSQEKTVSVRTGGP